MPNELEPVKPKRKYERRVQPQVQFRAPVIIELTLVGAKNPEIIEAFSYTLTGGFLRIALPGEIPMMQKSRYVAVSRIADLVIQEMVQPPQFQQAPQVQHVEAPEPREFTPRGGWRSLRQRQMPDGRVVSEAINENGQVEHVNAGFIE